MGFPEQYDQIFNSTPNLKRVAVAVLKVAELKQPNAPPATPTNQEVRESLLAYDAFREPETVARYFLGIGIAMNGINDLNANTDAQIEAFVSANWTQVAGVVNDPRADSTSPGA